MTDPIRIACQSDTRFLPDCAVMLRSLLAENPAEPFVIHFVHDASVAPENLELLASLVKSFGARWEPLMITDALREGFPLKPRYGGFTAWYRIFLPTLLPQVERVLYLDADTLIVGRVRPLWETDLSGKCLAAVTNPLLDYMVERITRTLGLPDGSAYFNSGVMLLDLAALRRGGHVEAIVDFVRKRTAPMPWADQEPLNAVLWRHRLALHPRWNAMNALYDLDWSYLPWSFEECRAAAEQPIVLHFVGPHKPWHYRCRHPYRARYFEHLRQTPWQGRPIEGRSFANACLRPLPVLWQWRIEALARNVRAIPGRAWRWMTRVLGFATA